MTPEAQAEYDRLNDTDPNPPKRTKHITLAAAIAHAEREGWVNFDYGNTFYRKDWRTGQWKGTVSK